MCGIAPTYSKETMHMDDDRGELVARRAGQLVARDYH